MPQPAVRRLADGVVEECSFFGEQRRLFGFSHFPLSGPRASLLVCSPIHAEFAKNYRREVLLARTLARMGIAVQRFHYRGTGRSEGAAQETTMESMCQDALEAFRHLSTRAGGGRPAILGVRWGGLVAARAAALLDHSALVLWDPVLDPARYLQEVIRVRQIQELREGGEDRRSYEELLDDLRRDGKLTVLDFHIHNRLFESSLGVSLGLGSAARAVLLVQVSRSQQPRPEYLAIRELLEGSGASLEMQLVGEDEAWWFEGDRFEPEETRPLTQRLIRITTDWLDNRVLAEVGL